MRLQSGFRIAPKWPLTAQFADMTLSLNFFDVANFVFKFSYWFKFHVNTITSFRAITIFLYEGLNRNLEPSLSRICRIQLWC